MKPAPTVVRAEAPAKVNLVLDVLGRRPDGYHELSTWMLAVGLFDEVRVRGCALPGLTLAVSGPAATPDVAADATNLVWRAGRAVLDLAETLRAGSADAHAAPLGLAIELEKRIPSQSGLGGASSDAAATVLAAERVLGLTLSGARRTALLAALGSDCAFFAGAPSGLARCGGRGERLLELPERAPRWHVAILAPEVRCSTPAVYAALARSLSPRARVPSLPPAWLGAPASDARAFLFNRLEAAALEVAPELRTWRTLFDAIGADHVRLSGSGSAFFALFDERSGAETFCTRVEQEARRQGLVLRGRWVVEAAGRGAKVQEN